MQRLTITLENYDNSKIVCSSLLHHGDELTATSSVLGRSKIEFFVEAVEGELYDYHLDDGDRCFELALRTKKEVEAWIHLEPFEAAVKSFLESGDASLRLSLDSNDAYLKIDRSNQSFNF